MNTPKPFVARGSKLKRCEGCLLAASVCICHYKVQYSADATFLLLMHHEEGFKPTNTGRLIEHCFPGTLRFKWSRTEPNDDFIKLINSPDYDPYLVFPESDNHAHRMKNYKASASKRPLFIILDGTWRQASRMFRLSQYLENIPVIQLDVTTASSYKLRKAAKEGQLCTAEVAAELLGLIGDTQGQQLLSAYFDVFNHHYKAARMSKPPEGCSQSKQLLYQYISKAD